MNPEELKGHIDRILSSSFFKRTINSKKILRYLYRTLQDGTQSTLKEYTIGVDALGRGADFDPQLDTSVRVEMNRLRSRLTGYYKVEGAKENFRIKIPKGKYMLEISESSGHSGTLYLEERYPAHLFAGKRTIELQLNLRAFNKPEELQHPIIPLLIDQCQSLKFCTTTLIQSEDEFHQAESSFTAGDVLHFSIMVSSYKAGGMETIFISLIDKEKNHIIFSNRLSVEPEKWDLFENRLSGIMREIEEILHPLSDYIYIKLKTKAQGLCRFWDAYDLIRFHEIHEDHYSLLKAEQILQQLYQKSPDDIVVLALYTESLIIDELLWCQPHPDLEEYIGLLIEKTQGLDLSHPLMFDCFLAIYFYRKDTVSLARTLHSLNPDDIGDPLLLAHWIFCLYFTGQKNLAMEKYWKNYHSQRTIPKWWYLFSGLDALSREDISGFKEALHGISPSSLPRTLLLRSIFFTLTGDENSCTSSLRAATEKLKGQDPLDYLENCSGFSELRPFFGKQLSHFSI